MLDIAEDYGWHVDWWDVEVKVWQSYILKVLFECNITQWDKDASDTI